MRSPGAAAAIVLGSTLLVGACGAGPGVEGIAPPWPMPFVGSASGDDPVKTPEARVQPHGNQILAGMSLAAVYIGNENVDGVANRDDFLSWVITSDAYWARLGQYGVGFGALVSSTRIASLPFFATAGSEPGFVSQDQLANAVASYVNAAPSAATAFIFFLPTSVGITGYPGGSQQNCLAFGGYHSYLTASDGSPTLPYAIVPPCANFPGDMPTSHELVEMATNPFGEGWYDSQNGQEIGDLCNFPVSQSIDLWSPSRFWSNADGACVPP